MSLAKIIAVITAMLFAGGCGTNEPKEPEPPAKTAEWKEIRSFEYQHSGSISYDGYYYTFCKDEKGVHLDASMNCGWERLSVDLDAEIMKQLEDITYEHQMQNWDGFNESDSNILDGEGFSLHIEFMDGTGVAAHGNNAFPRGFGAAETAFNSLFWELTEVYADKITESNPADEW